MYHVSVYPITPGLRRWEVRCGRVLVHCGTARTRAAARRVVQLVKNIASA